MKHLFANATKMNCPLAPSLLRKGLKDGKKVFPIEIILRGEFVSIRRKWQ
ncbi:MAG: hypothetical protein UZ01_01221 [Candidatus Brocadia sinica]|nr:MAG: hypothetical protein UZ01_01221 [Candidatus Brocadia sinica]